MAVVTKQELEDASVDAQTLEDVINGAPDINGTGLVTSRLGQVIKTVSKSIQDLNTVGVVTSAISALEVELGAPASSLVIETNGNVKVPNGLNATTTLVLKTAGTERVRVDADGLKFNGDTAAANALDDYEEGVWTPVISGAVSAPTGISYSQQVGRYTKVGNLVTLSFFLQGTITGLGSGDIFIEGCPFVNPSLEPITLAGAFGYLPLNVYGYIATSQTYIRMGIMASGDALNTLLWASGGVSATNFQLHASFAMLV